MTTNKRGTPIHASAYTLFMRMKHGLGDNVQCSIVLKHLKHYHPDWQITVESPPGTQDCYRDFVHSAEVVSYPFRNFGWSRAEYMHWPRARESYRGVPSTKVTRTLKDVFKLEPIEDLYRYHVAQTDEQIIKAAEYLHTLPDSNGVCLIHYEGNSSPERKNLSHNQAGHLCDMLESRGFLPVILDWSGRNPLVIKEGKHSPPPELWGEVTEAGLMAALIEQSHFFFGIDSGPAHVAAATNTPSVVFWTNFHPIHNFDLADNVVHVVPDWHLDLIHLDGSYWDAVWYFEKNYNWKMYHDGDIVDKMEELVENMFTEEEMKTAAISEDMTAVDS